MSALFAATYPERTAALVAWARSPGGCWAPDYPIGRRPSRTRGSADREDWGLPVARRFVDERAPSVAGDEEAIAGTPPTSSAARARRGGRSSRG